jgi:hypothetical protein
MTTAAATKKSKLSRLSATIREQDRQLKAEALKTWQRWATDLAAGGDCPSAREVIDVAAILGVDNAAAQLQADADAIAEFDQAERNIALCRKAVADKLQPFGGRVEKLEAAVQAAKSEHARLAAILDEVHGGASESFWTARITRLKRQTSRIWPEAALPVIHHDDEIETEVVE